MSSPRTTTYYYYPVKSVSTPRQEFDHLSVTRTPRTPTPSTPELSYCSTPTTTPNTSPQQQTATMRTRTVTFGLPEGVRDPLVDERDVMRKFHSHISRCETCYENLSSWHSGRPLCSRGHGYVLDMKPYFFCKGGKPFSMIDREKRDERNRVFVPTEYRYVTTLFEATEGGYRTGSTRSVPRPKIVIHQTPVQPQETSPRREYRRQAEPVVLVPAERYVVASPRSPRTPRTQYREERYHREPRRGSLYYDEQGRRYQNPEIVVATPDRYYR